MTLPRHTPIIATILAAITIGFFIFHTSEKDQIRQQLKKLSETVSTAHEEPGLLAKAKVISSFQDLFANPLILDTNYRQARGVYAPKELAAAFLSLLQSGKTVQLTFTSTSITLLEQNQATLTTTASATLTSPSAKTQSTTNPLKISLRKSDKGWQIETIHSN